ncbi:hypothetical protein V6N12_075672 [Hibiscus sabdariffa]|uniref:Uncharacterized protein n=1 Tax=Hibiscus sabdariffa TaxID=183260 RepID=A0ABR2C898_9ROSI
MHGIPVLPIVWTLPPLISTSSPLNPSRSASAGGESAASHGFTLPAGGDFFQLLDISPAVNGDQNRCNELKKSCLAVDTMSSSTIADTVGRWGESLDDFSDDEENIVPITEDDDIHLLDADDVETIVADANEGNDLDVEDDVWSAAIARLGLRNEKPVWGYVGPETEQPVPSYPAYEPPSRMYDVNYTEMRDREHLARVFGSSSSSNYGELDRMISLQSEATSMRVRTFDPNGYEFSVEAMVRGAHE